MRQRVRALLRKRWRPGPAFWLLLALWLVIAGVDAAFIINDPHIDRRSDIAFHIGVSQSLTHAIDSAGLAGVWLAVNDGMTRWPPLPHLYYGGLGWLLGNSPLQLRLYSLLLLPPLMWIVFRIGVHLRGARVGALAAALTVVAAGIAGQARVVTSDLPTTVAVSLAILALVRPPRLTTPGGILLFGAACGLCALTRYQGLFYLFAPALLVALSSLRRAESWPARARRAGWMLLAAAVAVLMSALHWGGRAELFLVEARAHLDTTQVPSLDAGSGFFAGLAYFVGALGRNAGWTTFVLAVAAAGLLLARRARGWAVPALWVLGGMVAMSVTVIRETRHLLPAVPALALLASMGVSEARAMLRGKLVRQLPETAALLGACLITLAAQGAFAGKHGSSLWFDQDHVREPMAERTAVHAAPLVRQLRREQRREPALVVVAAEAEAVALFANAAPLLRRRCPDLIWCLRGMSSQTLCKRGLLMRGNVLVLDSDDESGLPLLRRAVDGDGVNLYRVPRARLVDVLVW